jgi:hypothetical protein
VKIRLFLFAGGVLAIIGGVTAGPIELEPKEMAPPPNITSSEPWYFNLGMPGWLAFVSGDIGLHGTTSNVDVGFDQILTHLTGIATMSVEVRKGRFGVYGDFLYMSLSAGVYNNGLIKKVNLGLSQYLADGEVYYRILEGPRGSLDLRAGARYTNLYSTLQLTASDGKINQAATELVNAAKDRVRGVLERLLQHRLDGQNPPIPVPPLGPDEKIKLIKLILAAKQNPNPGVVQQKIARILKRQLNRGFSLTEYWTDPYIGIGGRYNMSKTFYLTGKADVGGFGAGSDVSVQAYGALGCQISRSIYSEVGYRYLYEDYDSGGFLYKVSTQGPQITAGIIF